uniref:Aquaporin n=1 Tax=Strongyloides venezuelensis TaxID=75913 RepID=A0A0K0F723_STRVS
MRLWICSLLFYTFIYLTCEIGRFQFSKFDKSKHKSIIIILEFIGTVQICAPMFDVNIIIESYGMTGVLIEIIFIEICNSYLLRDAYGDPCPIIGKLLNKKSWKWFSILLSTQFLAGLTSFRLAKYWWSLKFHPIYDEIIGKENCEADLTVTLIYGMVIEAMGVICSKYIENLLEKYINDEMWNIIFNSISSGIICIMGIQLTGMYANPIVAWACTFNCEGVSHIGHFLVYWIAPVFAHYVIGNFHDVECHNSSLNDKIEEKDEIEKSKNDDTKYETDIIDKEESIDCDTNEEILTNLNEKNVENGNNIKFTIDLIDDKKKLQKKLGGNRIIKENSKKLDESFIEEEDYEEEEIDEEENSSECSIAQKYSTD